jgi:UDP-N-acetyl-D-glucosamine dehydrogenase
LLIGVAYKKNVEDTRESPALHLIKLLERRGAEVEYHDPHVPRIGPTREHSELAGRRSVPLSPETIGRFDAVLIATDHDAVDYRLLVRSAKLVVDTRNVCRRAGIESEKVVKA